MSICVLQEADVVLGSNMQGLDPVKHFVKEVPSLTLSEGEKVAGSTSGQCSLRKVEGSHVRGVLCFLGLPLP